MNLIFPNLLVNQSKDREKEIDREVNAKSFFT